MDGWIVILTVCAGGNADFVEDNDDQFEYELGPIVQEALDQLGQRAEVLALSRQQRVRRTEVRKDKSPEVKAKKVSGLKYCPRSFYISGDNDETNLGEI